MYKTECKESKVDEEICVIYGVSDGADFFLDFTTDEESAKIFVTFLNENDVEICHVADLIEDLFYSC